jgi:Phosphoribosylanthranilate isomerase
VTWVKVCGLTREADVALAVEAGADAVGFVVSDRSPRGISVARAAALMEGVPRVRVVVTVDVPPAVAVRILEATGADGIQPHGRHGEAVAEVAHRRGSFVLRPIPVAAEGPLLDPSEVPEEQVPIFDVADPRHGGTGRRLDWSSLPAVHRRFVLAGGLGPANVAAAVREVRPWGVDASSGLEAAPGVKDRGKVVAFIEEAKRA